MSTLEVNKITPVSGGTTVQVGESGNTINIPSGATITNSGTANNFTSYRPNAKGLIINGDMAVAQRGTSTSGVTSSGYYACDRWRTGIGIGTWTISQDTDVPTGQGFAKSMKIDCTTANASPSASSNFGLATKFEGQDLQYLKKGTSNALSLTFSFWVKSNKTGDYTLEITDSDNSRSISQSYSISSANTWEKKTLTFAGDTTGTLDNDNAQSIELNWWLSAGSNYTSGTLQTSWGSQVTANRAVSTQVNLADSTANEWYITGVQLEVGEYTSATIPPFQHESYADNESRCLRYFEKSYEVGVNPGTATSTGIIRSGGNQGGRTSGRMGGGTTYVVGKRAAPTVVFYDSSGNSGVMSRVDQGSGSGTSQNATLASGSSKSMQVISTGTYTGDVMNYHFTADAEL